jgi:hypothetical protein
MTLIPLPGLVLLGIAPSAGVGLLPGDAHELR